VVLAITAASVLGLTRNVQRVWSKIGCAILMLALILLLIWTGSRTGIVVLVTAIACVLLPRPLALVLVATMVLIACVVIVQNVYVSDSLMDNAEFRALSASNTRQAVWDSLWTEFTTHWLLGGDPINTPSESSLLVVLARTGITGGMVFFLSLSLMFREAYGLLGSSVPGATGAFDRVAGAIILAILVGGVFEGILRDEFSFPIFTLYTLLAIGAGRREVLRIANSVYHRAPSSRTTVTVATPSAR
jgi:hypothetical protein